MKTDQEQVQLMKRRGGVGHDLSNIRPIGEIANGMPLGEDMGVPLYMERFSNSTREVAQDGRRGALMLSLSIDHPDADKFIDKKLDTNKVTGANISVKIGNNFMTNLENNKNSKLWDKIIYNAWKSAEPGILFWDTVLEESPTAGYGKKWEPISTNPCFHPDTLIETVEGRIPIKDIKKPIFVYSMDNKGKLCTSLAGPSFITKKEAKTLKITLKNGSFIQVTPDHKLYIHNKGWIMAKDLCVGDRVVHLSRNRRGKRYAGVKLTTQGYRDYIMEHHLVYNTVENFDKSKYSIHHKDGDTYNNKISNLQLMLSNEHNKYTALNDNPQTHQVRDKNTGRFIAPKKRALPKIKNVPEHLKTNLKNNSYNKIVSIENGETTDVYDIQVEKTHCLIANNMVAHNCGEIPLNPYDSCRLLALNLYSYVENPFTSKAKFNFELFKKHSFFAQRIMDDIIDLEIEKLDKIIAKVESDPESDDIKFVELNLWKNIKQMAIDGRRTGTGVTAEGDMLAALNLRYGSDKAIDFSEEVHKQLAISVYSSSIQLAKERGCFKDFNLDIEETFQSKFLDRILDVLDEDTRIDYQIFGRRNIACLTIAPTGTTSLMSQTTSGIEPVFMPVYKRRRKTRDKDKAVFTDNVGDMWEEYPVFHHKFLIWLNKNSTSGLMKIGDFNYKNNKDGWCLNINNKKIINPTIEQCINESPYYKATSNDVDYIKKVVMQGRIQKWIDHSISVTVNMNKNVTVEDVENVYKKAWEVGCKGITIYRDGSRSGVLVTDEVKESEFKQHSAPKRPKKIDCIVKHIKVKGEDYTALIGLLNNKPYEIFATKENINYTGKYIEKVKKNTYVCGDIKFIENMSEEQKTITRLISMALRHGAEIKFVVDQLNKVGGDLTSFSKAMARALKSFIKDGEISSETCPNKECGHKLIYKDGCKQCPNCGWTACS